ncbi:uncharacterized protein N7496_010064 [Penicillium cataractarum]|uniref:Major facilitator superfamily (MFS) profile domain-containing protein n=1 Tax=Penicillium cataractarum TaxID=2100454 RepID=A0A9W9RQ49_9EURO|nr:uncharacterized protein N7496_010064 [Penicillium cataractarum]KAJ5364351.1 hypothetical protein N7496_010064 [Penicillium cataractarum]
MTACQEEDLPIGNPNLEAPNEPSTEPIQDSLIVNKQQWAFFAVAFWGWTWDALDFFTVSLTTTELAETFNKSITDISWGMTLVLMLRSAGAITFGIASDRWGRKWRFVVNLILFSVFELATGFAQTFQQFLASRALFGIAMGGLYGNAVATALEDCPTEARGIMSGILQLGYVFGYLLATVFSRALVNTTSHGWRPLFWFSAGPPVLIIIGRVFLPETMAFQQRQRLRNERRNTAATTFIQEGKDAVKNHGLIFIYLFLFAAGINFMSHGSQDLYPTMLKVQYGFSSTQVTVTQVIAKVGAIFGGTFCGWISQIIGRRLSVIIISIIGGALIYPYTFVGGKAVIASAFFEQFMVQGVAAIVPIHMLELSPASSCTFVVGVAYQLGNLASSASSTIDSTRRQRRGVYQHSPMITLKNHAHEDLHHRWI